MTNRQPVGNFPDDGINQAVGSFIADVLELAGLFRRTADEIAGAAVFLASAAGSFTTGQTIVIDGGRMAGAPLNKDD